MQFHVSRSAPPTPRIQATGQLAPFVTSIQLLGIRLQSSLRWVAHINSITAKANSKRCFLLVLQCAGISAPDLVKFYTTYMKPTLWYAAPVWHANISDALPDKIAGAVVITGAGMAERVSELDRLSLRCAAIIMLRVSNLGLCP